MFLKNSCQMKYLQFLLKSTISVFQFSQHFLVILTETQSDVVKVPSTSFPKTLVNIQLNNRFLCDHLFGKKLKLMWQTSQPIKTLDSEFICIISFQYIYLDANVKTKNMQFCMKIKTYSIKQTNWLVKCKDECKTRNVCRIVNIGHRTIGMKCISMRMFSYVKRFLAIQRRCRGVILVCNFIDIHFVFGEWRNRQANQNANGGDQIVCWIAN